MWFALQPSADGVRVGSGAAAAEQRAAWRALSPTDKLALVREATEAVLWLEREGLRRRHPTMGPDALHRAAVERRLGAALAARAYAHRAR